MVKRKGMFTSLLCLSTYSSFICRYPGHEEIEIALVRAHERTGDDMLKDLAKYFIEERGQTRPEGHYYDIEAQARGDPPRPGPGHGPPYSYHQADRPIREMTSIEGHSVRAMYVIL